MSEYATLLPILVSYPVWKQLTELCPPPRKVDVASRILLIYPETPDTYWSYRHALEFVGKKAIMPPLGLLTAAAIMGEEYEYRLIDMNVEPLKDGSLEWADYVFVSAMIVQADSMREVIERCNGAGVPVVAGGPYPTSCYQEIEGVDHFVLDEGEQTIPEFRRDLEKGTLKPIYRAGERPQIDAAFDAGFRGKLFIVDDNFIGNRRRAKELLRRILAWQEEMGFPFNLSTEASIDLAEDRELLDLMTACGFKMVFVGVETPVQDTLREERQAAETPRGVAMPRPSHSSRDTLVSEVLLHRR